MVLIKRRASQNSCRAEILSAKSVNSTLNAAPASGRTNNLARYLEFRRFANDHGHVFTKHRLPRSSISWLPGRSANSLSYLVFAANPPSMKTDRSLRRVWTVS